MTTYGVIAAVVVSALTPDGATAYKSAPNSAGHYVQAATAGQAQPPLVNARLESRAVKGGLAGEIGSVAARGTPLWVAYAVPMIQRPRGYMAVAPRGCRLEPPTDLLVLARFEGGRIVELRGQGVDCDLDASGMQVVWLTAVAPDESVAWLTSIAIPSESGQAAGAARPSGGDQVARSALAAAALHETPSAARTLIELARNGATPELRGRALVYLGQRASDKAAADTIVNAIDNDPDMEVKRRAVMALSRLPDGEGIPVLIELARTHRSADVRRQAVRHLGQSRDPRALQFFTQVLLKE